jgi:NAD-dependent deacetylase
MKPSNSSPKIIFLTGSGLSADSGLATFRGNGGLYNGFAGPDLMSSEMLAKTPEVVHRFCDDLRVGLADARPNPAHEMIARLRQRYGAQVIHFTQNFDDLCERAGDDKVIHIHGELTKLRAQHNTKEIVDIGYTRYWGGSPSQITTRGAQFRCRFSGKHYRPDVVLFGEPAPRYRPMWTTFKRARRDDMVIVIGTQGSVAPVQQLCLMAPGPKILLNLHESEDIDSGLFRHFFQESAAAASSEVETLIHEHVEAAMSRPRRGR